MIGFLVVCGVLAVFLVIGLVANRWVRPFAKNETAGVKLELLVSPLLTLTILLLAFVLVQVFAGYRSAKDAAALEAGRSGYQYDVAGYYPERIARPLQGQLVCYVRSVAFQEWQTLSDGELFDPTTSFWARGIDESLKAIPKYNDAQPYGTLLTADKERGDQRRLRIVQARPAVPVPIQLLLLMVSALAILAIAAFTLPYVSRRTQIGALIVLTGVLAAVQLAILDMDNKFDGVITVDNQDFVIMDQLLTPRFQTSYGIAPPCSPDGTPV